MSQTVQPSKIAEAFQGFGTDLTSVREALVKKQAVDRAAKAALEDSVRSLTGEKESLSSRVTTLSQEKDDLTAKVAEYAEKTGSLEKQVSSLEADGSSINSTLDKLEGAHRVTVEELGQAKSTNAELLQRLAAMEVRAEMAERQVSQMAADMAGFKDGLLRELELTS
jgi:chromosome segregation ATPase